MNKRIYYKVKSVYTFTETFIRVAEKIIIIQVLVNIPS